MYNSWVLVTFKRPISKMFKAVKGFPCFINLLVPNVVCTTMIRRYSHKCVDSMLSLRPWCPFTFHSSLPKQTPLWIQDAVFYKLKYHINPVKSNNMLDYELFSWKHHFHFPWQTSNTDMITNNYFFYHQLIFQWLLLLRV